MSQIHHRERHIFKSFNKKSKLFPVLGLLGPRQVGKTTFLQKQWQSEDKKYITFDRLEHRNRAKIRPESFLLSETNNLKNKLIIDEAQKVPDIFDSIKAIIDDRRRVGIFTLSGSVEFSDKAGIRESLTGRIGISRLFPMNLSELSKSKPTYPWTTKLLDKNRLKIGKAKINEWMKKGGMPIFCSINNYTERNLAVESWIEAVCYKDLSTLGKTRYDGSLAIEILRELSINSLLNISQMSNLLNANHNEIKKYINSLQHLFLLYTLSSFENKRAAKKYFLFDNALLNFLYGRSDTKELEHKSLVTLILNEIFSQFEYSSSSSNLSKPSVSYYKTRGGAEVDIILEYKNNKENKTELIAVEAMISEKIHPYKLKGINSFLKKYKHAIGYVIAPVSDLYQEEERLFIVPWEYIG